LWCIRGKEETAQRKRRKRQRQRKRGGEDLYVRASNLLELLRFKELRQALIQRRVEEPSLKRKVPWTLGCSVARSHKDEGSLFLLCDLMLLLLLFCMLNLSPIIDEDRRRQTLLFSFRFPFSSMQLLIDAVACSKVSRSKHTQKKGELRSGSAIRVYRWKL
jgi:hypothetical protein